ncbi:MAG: hypothetical protein GY832_01425 [Chloroflexi bacterium]|nr:hypothetical protein [Chloroflexota bacterium]
MGTNKKTQPTKPHPHRIGRNSPCPCGRRRKYKKCCLGKPRFSFTTPPD